MVMIIILHPGCEVLKDFNRGIVKKYYILTVPMMKFQCAEKEIAE